jgi:hypothetical protein
MTDETRFSVKQAILGYLADHPDAQDTFAGILEWWVLERFVLWSSDEVKAALAELQAQQ